MRLTVIIPVYNEEATVTKVIDQVRKCGVPDLQIIVVNDCSQDGTRARLEELPPASDLLIVHHEQNQGKGAAIRTGQALVDGDVVVIQDADLEYSPSEFPKMLRLIENDKADAVYGSRYSGSTTLVDTFWHFYGNKLITGFFNLVANLHLTDMETCYKMVRADIFKSLQLTSNRFGFEPEISAKLAKLRCRIYEVPIEYRPRPSSQGKKIGWKDGVAAFWHIIKFNLLS
jgi:glycosyltransferase involved in cell wall biosynthesis